jgi:hypothetical protein
MRQIWSSSVSSDHGTSTGNLIHDREEIQQQFQQKFIGNSTGIL